MEGGESRPGRHIHVYTQAEETTVTKTLSQELAGKFKNSNMAIVVGTEQKNIRKSHYKVEC